VLQIENPGILRCSEEVLSGDCHEAVCVLVHGFKDETAASETAVLFLFVRGLSTAAGWDEEPNGGSE
jgi:hypothetical protein